jgi:transcriptional regulator of arginine metabolism
MNMQNTRMFMHADALQAERRTAILRILRDSPVRKQDELVRLLRREGHEATQSSISRDLRDLGVLKASGRYLPPSDDSSRTQGNFDALRQFVRGVATAGPSLTVVRTTIGAAQSVAIAIDKAEWPEVVGTISGDDTIFLATDTGRAQAQVVERLRSLFRV